MAQQGTALLLHFDEWPFVDSSDENKLVTTNGTIITTETTSGSTPMVLSVEKVEVTLDTVASRTVNLTKGQDISNCVPFASIKSDENATAPSELLPDIYFQAGPQVVVERGAATGATTEVIVYVVEFNPTVIKVQQKTFAIAANTKNTDISIDSVPATKAFLLMYDKVTTGGTASQIRYWNQEARFRGGAPYSTIRVDRTTTTGTFACQGHLYVIEDIDGNYFDVQYIVASIANLNLSNTYSISQIDQEKTAIISNNNGSHTSNNPGNHWWRASFQDDTTLLFERKYSPGYSVGGVWVVSFKDGTRVRQRRFIYNNPGVLQDDHTYTDDLFNPERTIAYPTNRIGIMRGGLNVSDCLQRVELIDPNTVEGTRATGLEGSSFSDGNLSIVEFIPLASEGEGSFTSGTYLQIPKANVWHPGIEEFSADLRVKHSGTLGTQTYLSQFEDINNRWHLRHIKNIGINFQFVKDSITSLNLSGAGGEITDSNEHHVAISQKDDTYRLFLDGVKIDEDTVAGLDLSLVDSDLFVGAVSGGSGDNFFGSMANIRVSTAARFVNTFSPQTTGSYIPDDDTQLLITFSTSAAEDSSESGHSVWNPNQVTRGNFDSGLRVYRFGNQCGFFPGSQDGFAPYSLQLPDHPNWYIADKDFTLESWLYPLSHLNYAGIMHQNTRWYWYIDAAGKLNWYVEDGSSTFSMQSSGTVPIDEWSHCALTRSLELTGAGNTGQVWRMYIKGIIQDIVAEDFTIPNLVGPMWIGRGTGTSDLFHGYMDELRLLLNKAVWTEDEFWPWDYPYLDEAFVHRYRRMHRRRIHAIQGR